ncbi:MAG: DeoR/GlpR transcriptional regulator [Lachnospiraceae bacterium]|nr:DeoR/GlpR transcriptional regulator [Lachnospiraceae bacterium]
MDRDKRICEIEKFVVRNKIVTVSEIAKHLHISESTVRRDVEIMASKELVIQRHGSITSSNFKGQGFESFDRRKEENLEEKRAIGRCVANFLKDNDVIFMEGGTTQLEIARCITEKNITVITVDLNIAMMLAASASVTTIVLGGCIWAGTYLLVGDMVEMNIKNMHFTYYLSSPGAIMQDGRLIYHNIQLSSIRTQGMALAEQVVIAADSSKFGKSGFFSNGYLQDVDVLISDEVPEAYRELMPERGRILIAE